jgi:hypothetical protein
MSELLPVVSPQLSLFTEELSAGALGQALLELAEADQHERGAVFTRREVVDLILDLSQYTIDRPLWRFRLLEPSFGAGDFLLPAIERLLASYSLKENADQVITDLKPCVRAVEIHTSTFNATRQRVIDLLVEKKLPPAAAMELADVWLIPGDFLLASLPHTFTHIVGNPPYVRQELIPPVLLKEYKARYTTIYDRADLYIPFIERCLKSLAPAGTLAIICADRWMKNKYGGPLRQLIDRQFSLRFYINMVDAPAFNSEVSAYPGIFVFANEKSETTRIVAESPKDLNSLGAMADQLLRLSPPPPVETLDKIANGEAPWIIKGARELDLLRRLENDFPTLEEAGCKVGIGVATGADRIFIAPFDELAVEPSRKLPLVKTKDIDTGDVCWRGLGVLNPFEETGELADLSRYPRFADYLRLHEKAIRQRNCARNNEKGWYRTIDRIYTDLAATPKLLIPDIKGAAHIVYENGQYYPHHNLYYITSQGWSLLALQVVLKSPITDFFIKAYSTQMRGGYLRFQAQYLRRLRIPHWDMISAEVKKHLIESRDPMMPEVAREIYSLSSKEMQWLDQLMTR